MSTDAIMMQSHPPQKQQQQASRGPSQAMTAVASYHTRIVLPCTTWPHMDSWPPVLRRHSPPQVPVRFVVFLGYGFRSGDFPWQQRATCTFPATRPSCFSLTHGPLDLTALVCAGDVMSANISKQRRKRRLLCVHYLPVPHALTVRPSVPLV